LTLWRTVVHKIEKHHPKKRTSVLLNKINKVLKRTDVHKNRGPTLDL